MEHECDVQPPQVAPDDGMNAPELLKPKAEKHFLTECESQSGQCGCSAAPRTSFSNFTWQDWHRNSYMGIVVLHGSRWYTAAVLAAVTCMSILVFARGCN